MSPDMCSYGIYRLSNRPRWMAAAPRNIRGV
jgi:hypothetical protein